MSDSVQYCFSIKKHGRPVLTSITLSPARPLWWLIHQLLLRPQNQIHNPEPNIIEHKNFWQLQVFTKDFIQLLLSDFACIFRVHCIAHSKSKQRG